MVAGDENDDTARSGSGEVRDWRRRVDRGGLDDEQPVPGSWSAGRRDEQQQAAELEPVRSWRRAGGRKCKEGVWITRSEAGEHEEVGFVMVMVMA